VDHLVSELGSGRMNQRLIHLFTWNQRWMALLAERNRRAAVSTYEFIDEKMPEALFTLSQMQVVEARSADMMQLDGHVLDLGVYKGGSTRALARIFPDRHIHGFDSFEGLPEDWAHVPRGDFGDVAGVMPDMPPNVTLHKGWFDETLPVWMAEHGDRPISVLRVDCDIYSSTRTIFEVLEPLIRPGTWIIFDELIGYKNWEQHEYRAFMEFIGRTKYEYEFIAYGLTYTIVHLTP
jgi:predicted O-methyltransferase YrrM